MSKRIVVGLDGSPYATAATEAAIERARRSRGTVVGVAVIDTPGIEHSEVGAGPGAAHMAGSLMDEKLADAKQRTRQFLIRFGNQCKQAGVSFELAREEGAPFDVLIEVGRSSDLIVVGLETYFHFETSGEPGDTVSRLLRNPVTPVLGVPETWVSPQQVLITYQHQLHSARALTAFVHQHNLAPFADEIHLLHVDDGEDPEVWKRDLEQAENYLKSYGISVTCETRKGSVGEVLLKAAHELEPCMVVLGVPQRNWLKDLFGESLTDTLLRERRIPVFAYQ